MSNEMNNIELIPQNVNNQNLYTSNIQKCELNQSILSDTSLDGINQCLIMLSSNKKIINNEDINNNLKEKRINLHKRPFIPHQCKLINNLLSPENHRVSGVIHSKNNNQSKFKIRLQSEKNKLHINYNGKENNLLQVKAKKMLNDLKSIKLKKEEDIEEFKNEFDLYSPIKQNPFGLRDFEKKFKRYLTLGNQKWKTYDHLGTDNNFSNYYKFKVKLGFLNSKNAEILEF